MQTLNENELETVNGGIYSGSLIRYSVQKGDCLSVIAQKYNTSVKAICEMNGVSGPADIMPGRVILLPKK